VVLNWGSSSGNINAKGINACGSGQSLVTTVTVNCRVTDPGESLPAFLLSPNPANDKVNMTVYSNVPSAGIITINDLLGRTIFSENFDLAEGDNIVTLDLKEILNGIYIVSLDHEGMRQSGKLIIE